MILVFLSFSMFSRSAGGAFLNLYEQTYIFSELPFCFVVHVQKLTLLTMRIVLSVFVLSLIGSGEASMVTASPKYVQATPTVRARNDFKIDAIVPTTAGQIGINPVESDLGDPDTYVGQIYGTDTQYITLADTTTAVSLTTWKR